MKFQILGQLRVESQGTTLTLPGPREQRALAALLVAAGRPVPTHRMIETIWGENPPAEAERRLHNVVYRLRRALAAAGHPDAVRNVAGGYHMPFDHDDLDAAVFADAVAQAQRDAAQGRIADAAKGLRGALGLWRGPALDGLDVPILEAAATAWNEQRVAAQAACATHLLALGRHEEAVPELTALLGHYPLREDLAALLITALYRCGRQADALTLYTDTRARLVRDAGVEPGAALRLLHHQVLTSDPALDAPPQEPPTATPSRPTPEPRPFQLPPTVRGFVGRQVEYDRLTAAATPVGDDSAPVVVLSGLGGIGKSALATLWARRNAERFPHGVLMSDLRGFDPGGRPADPADVLEAFLRALGVAPETIPRSLAERSALFRTALAGRRVLIILDNADRAERVRPLLAGAPGCPTIVTSRDALSGLVARDGATRILLGPLPHKESRTLLSETVGTARLASAPEATQILLNSCAGVPLALRVAAEHLASRPDTPISELAHPLSDAHTALDFLSIEADQPTTLRSVFTWSYRALPTGHADALRLIAHLAPVDIGALATAALCAIPVQAAIKTLNELADSHLLTRTGHERFGLHDLVRAFGSDLAQQTDAPQTLQTAAGRLAAWYLHSAAAADRLLMPQRRNIDPGPVPEYCQPQPLYEHAEAMAWCEDERANFLPMLRTATEHGHCDTAWRLTARLSGFYLQTKNWSDWQTACEIGARAAEAAGEVEGLARLTNDLGIVYGDTHRYPLAAQSFTRAAQLRESIGDYNGQAASLCNLSGIHHRTGDYEKAIGLLVEVRQIHVEQADAYGEALTLTNLGAACTELGRHAEALEYLDAALSMMRKLDNRYALGMTLDNLGKLLQAMRRPDQALAHHQEALRIFQETHDDFNEAGTLHLIGTALIDTGRREEARRTLRASLTLFRQAGADDDPEAKEVLSLLDAHFPADSPAA